MLWKKARQNGLRELQYANPICLTEGRKHGKDICSPWTRCKCKGDRYAQNSRMDMDSSQQQT